jgi:hypothetical protein
MSIPNQPAGAVITLEVPRFEKSYFVTSDVHIDSVYCHRKAFFTDLDQAVERDAGIIIVGDLFDAMMGRFDPRRDLEKVRPEYRNNKYYDSLVDDAYSMLKKYVKNIELITPGNHETAVLKNANTYLSDRIVNLLNAAGGKVIHGGYGGWIRVLIKHKNHTYETINIKYFHGSGGEAPVTRGVIQTNRQAVFLPDADIILNGHSHNAYWVPITRERISSRGIHYFDTQHHVRTPGYNQAYGDGSEGWEVERGGVPKPIGGCFITIKAFGNKKTLLDNVITIQPLIHNPVPVAPIFDPYTGISFPQE